MVYTREETEEVEVLTESQDPDFELDLAPDFADDEPTAGYQPLHYIGDRPVFDQNQILSPSTLARGMVIWVKDTFSPDLVAVVLHGPVYDRNTLHIRIRDHKGRVHVCYLPDYSVVKYSSGKWAENRYLVDTGKIDLKYIRKR